MMVVKEYFKLNIKLKCKIDFKILLSKLNIWILNDKNNEQASNHPRVSPIVNN